MSFENRYWPFDVVPPEKRTEEIWREIRFLETTYEAGFKPYEFGSQNFGATSGIRGGIILYRGCRGNHWQVLLGTTNETIVEAHVDDFESAAKAMLQWLRGVEGSEIIETIRGHLFTDWVVAPGFVLHKPIVRAEGEADSLDQHQGNITKELADSLDPRPV